MEVTSVFMPQEVVVVTSDGGEGLHRVKCLTCGWGATTTPKDARLTAEKHRERVHTERVFVQVSL